jgi:hypothetical protein
VVGGEHNQELSSSQGCGTTGVALERLADRYVQDVLDWDDRTSPDDYPDHLLITPDELRRLLFGFADDAALSAAPQPPGGEGWSDFASGLDAEDLAHLQAKASAEIEGACSADAWVAKGALRRLLSAYRHALSDVPQPPPSESEFRSLVLDAVYIEDDADEWEGPRPRIEIRQPGLRELMRRLLPALPPPPGAS